MYVSHHTTPHHTTRRHADMPVIFHRRIPPPCHTQPHSIPSCRVAQIMSHKKLVKSNVMSSNVVENVSPDVQQFFATSSPHDIMNDVGEFYATFMLLGGTFNLTTIFEAREEDTEDSISAQFKAEYSGFVSAACSGSASAEEQKGQSTQNTTSSYSCTAGNTGAWLGFNGSNADEIQNEWAATINDSNLSPTQMTLRPIWEVIADKTKRAEVQSYLLDKWKQEDADTTAAFNKLGFFGDSKPGTLLPGEVHARTHARTHTCTCTCTHTHSTAHLL